MLGRRKVNRGGEETDENADTDDVTTEVGGLLHGMSTGGLPNGESIKNQLYVNNQIKSNPIKSSSFSTK